MPADKTAKKRPKTSNRSNPVGPAAERMKQEAAPISHVESAAQGNRGPPIAGIGASAGGLDAFKRFFAAMPPDSGIAFVLIPHLDPNHQSLMVELLSRCTEMPVVEATDALAVAPNRVYVLPPNKYMTIAGGALHLTGPVVRGGPQTSIDLFLRSLADDQKEKAIGIILSGTGAHGSQGLRAVKASGGMAMAQDPSTAEYPPMPEHAIATGLADYVLPPEKMPAALIQYLQHAGVKGVDRAETQAMVHQILTLLLAHTNLDFHGYLKKMLARRIERRMSLHWFHQIADYLGYLKENPQEIKRLAHDLLISVTSFFRDSEAFFTLATEVIAPLIRAKEPDASVRVWCAGCATGEEAYSLGILLLEQIAAAPTTCHLQIFATDADDDALDVARRGIYPDTILTDVSPERLARFFTRVEDGSFQVSKQLRDAVTFARQNLVADAPFSRLDLVACRNLLIYLEPEVQNKIIPLLHFSLNERGFLFLGPAETTGRHHDLFEPVSKKWRIFRRIGPARTRPVEMPIAVGATTRAPVRHLAPPSASRPVSFAELTHRLLLHDFAPSAVLVNRKYEILYSFGPADRYLLVPAGEPTQNLLQMAREGLRNKLRAAIQKAVRQGSPVKLRGVRVHHDGETHRVIVTIRQILEPPSADGLLLVTFQDKEPGALPPSAPETAEDESIVRLLEDELKATREDLQCTVEELEHANAELKTSNEEVLSMNEELQSANEELETSKEELQSLNEELATANNQLQDKVREFEAASNDLANLLNCSEVPIIVLDNQLRIKRFTPPASRLFSLIATDIDRPLSDITPKFNHNTLRDDIERMLRNLEPQERQVQTTDGCWWNRRITAYRTVNHRIEGVVLTFADVTRLRHADERAQRLAGVFWDSNDAVTVQELDGAITAWNQGAVRMFGYTEAEALQMNAMQMIPEELHAEVRSFWQRVRQGDCVDSWESRRKTKDGRLLDVWITATVLKDETGKPTAIVKSMRDTAELKRTLAELRRSEERYRTLFSTLIEGFCIIEMVFDAADQPIDYRFLEVNPAFEKQTGLRDAQGKLVRELVPNLDHHWFAIYGKIALTGKPARLVSEAKAMNRWYEVSAFRFGGPDSRKVAILFNDITENKRAEVELRDREAHLTAILNTATDAIITIDIGGIIQSANPATERLFGYTVAEMMGRNVNMLMPPPYRDEHDGYLQSYSTTGRKKIIGIGREVTGLRKDGGTFPVDLAVSEIEQSELFTGILRDITARKKAEDEMRRKERELREAQRIAHIGNWSWNIKTDMAKGSDEVFRIFGLDPAKDRLPGVPEPDDRLFPEESRQRLDAVIKESLQSGVRHELELEAFRGSVPIWVGVSSEVMRDAEGQIVGLRGTIQDITPRKQAEQSLRESERFARSTLDGLSAHIAIVDCEGCILAVNRSWRTFAAASGAAPASVEEGANYLRVCDQRLGLYKDEGPSVAAGIRAVVAKKIPEFVAEFPCHGPREERWFIVRVTPFPGEGPRRAVVAHEEITQRKQLEREVLEIAALEQRRIGQDLHDSVGQELTALSILAADLAALSRAESAADAGLIEKIGRGLQRSQSELRAALRRLLPVAVDAEGLMASLSDLAQRIQQEGKVTCWFDCPEPVVVGNNLTATHLYLIAQEAVHNAIKHGRPKNILITLESDDMLMLKVQDDGAGMPAPPDMDHGGVGMCIMRNRAAIIGARLDFVPVQPTGTLVTCALARTAHETKPIEETSQDPDRR